MPFEIEYRCEGCQRNWLLSGTCLSIGPTEWSRRSYGCGVCPVAVEVIKAIDQSSWTKWIDGNRASLEGNPFLWSLVEQVERQLLGAKPYKRIEIEFSEMICPGCKQDVLREETANQETKRCPYCGNATGEPIGTTMYAMRRIESEDEGV
jgi:Zn finger protein HypA/HybF involved in hydrogenase expression